MKHGKPFPPSDLIRLDKSLFCYVNIHIMIGYVRKKLRALFCTAVDTPAVRPAPVLPLSDPPVIPEAADPYRSVFDFLLEHHSVDFESFGRNLTMSGPSAGVAAVQVSMANPPARMMRHDEAAAAIMKRTAMDIAGINVPVHLVSDSLLNFNFNFEALGILRHADIVTMSYVEFTRSHNEKSFDASLKEKSIIHDDAKRAFLDSFLKESEAIILQSAGNEGRSFGLEGAMDQIFSPSYVLRSPHYIRVGAAVPDPQGNIVAAKYSSPACPTFICANPFDQGFLYQMFPDRVEYMDQLKNEYGARPEIRLLKLDTLAKFRRGYDIDDSNMAGPGIYGTSFTSPHAAGILGGIIGTIRREYGRVLTAFDIQAAAVLACRPVNDVFEPSRRQETDTPGIYSMTQEEFHKNALPYHDNGAGLDWNDARAGFGLLEEARALAYAASMAEMAVKDPSLRSKEASVTTGLILPEPELVENDGKATDYAINIDRDILAARILIDMRFPTPPDPPIAPMIFDVFGRGAYKIQPGSGGLTALPSAAPDIITLISPAGTEIRMPVTKEQGISLAETNGFFGNETQGTWRLRIPDNIRLDGVEMTIHGVERGSVIERHLERRRKERAAPELQERIQRDIRTFGL